MVVGFTTTYEISAEKVYMDYSFEDLGYWCLAPLSTIFQLLVYRGSQFLLLEEIRVPVVSHRQTLSHQILKTVIHINFFIGVTSIF
jgi:hypothetical protein